MLRKIGFAVIVGALLSTNAFAENRHYFSMGASLEYELPPHEPQTVINILPWNIKAECRVIADNSEATLIIKLVNDKSCIVNEVPLAKGETMGMIVRDGSRFMILANKGVHVELTNMSENTLKAKCATIA